MVWLWFALAVLILWLNPTCKVSIPSGCQQELAYISLGSQCWPSLLWGKWELSGASAQYFCGLVFSV